MKIAICLPIHSGAKPGFVQSFGALIDRTHRANLQFNGEPARPIIETLTYSSSSIAYSRCRIADAALERGADWMLWLDADQTFPADTLIRLLARGKPVIGANYRRRDPDKVASTAFAWRGDRLEPVFPKGDGVEEIAHLGLGACLTHAEVFRRIKRPYFAIVTQEDGRAIGEDVHFFHHVREAGIPVFMDHALSREVGHISDTELRFPE